MKVATLPEVTLSREIYGANIILGINGETKEDVEMFFNFLHNYGATPHGCELEWIKQEYGDFFAKIQLLEENLIIAFRTYFEIYNEFTIGMTEERAVKQAIVDAKDCYESIERDYYLRERHQENRENIGTTTATKNGHQFKISRN